MKKRWLFWFLPLLIIFLFLHQILSAISIYFGRCKTDYLYDAKVKLMFSCQNQTESVMKNILHASAFTLGNNIFTYRDSLSEDVILHELGHVYQYKKLGPLFLPAYGVAQIVAVINSKIKSYPNIHAGNFFESWADRLAGLPEESKY